MHSHLIVHLVQRLQEVNLQWPKLLIKSCPQSINRNMKLIASFILSSACCFSCLHWKVKKKKTYIIWRDKPWRYRLCWHQNPNIPTKCWSSFTNVGGWSARFLSFTRFVTVPLINSKYSLKMWQTDRPWFLCGAIVHSLSVICFLTVVMT